VNNTKRLQERLNGALNEYTRSVAEMCENLHKNGDYLSQEQLLHFIGNETAKCLSDYKTAVIDAFSQL